MMLCFILAFLCGAIDVNIKFYCIFIIFLNFYDFLFLLFHHIFFIFSFPFSFGQLSGLGYGWQLAIGNAQPRHHRARLVLTGLVRSTSLVALAALVEARPH